MKRRTKIVLIAGTFIIAVAFGIWYINKFILPVKIKNIALSIIKEKTGHTITVDRIKYFPFGRFYLNGVTIYGKGAPQKALINIEGLHLDLQILPLLMNKNLNGRLGMRGLVCGAVTANGATSLSLKRRDSSAARPFLNDFDGTIKLTNFSFVTDNLPSGLGSVNGSIILSDDTVRLSKTFFNCKNRTYNIEGAITGLGKEEPAATLSLNSDILASKGVFILKDNRHIQIKNIDGKLFSSSFNIIGDIKLQSLPRLSLYCEAALDLSDLKKAFPKSKYISDALKPAGMCKATVFFNGGIDDFRKSESGLKLASNKLFLHGLALNDLYLNLRLKDGLIGTESMTVKPYLGLFNGSFAADLNEKGHPFSVDFVLKNANLAKFSADMNFGKEDMTGLMSSEFHLRGYLKSADTLAGSGWINVSGSRLWEIPLLKGMAGVLGMPHLRSVVFNEAGGNFIIGQRRVSTQDLTLAGDKVNIGAAGYVDFDKNVDLLVNTNITQDLVEGSSDTAQIANLILSQAGEFMGRIRITGTLDKPQYNLAAKPIEELFNKEIKGLLKDILR